MPICARRIALAPTIALFFLTGCGGAGDLKPLVRDMAGGGGGDPVDSGLSESPDLAYRPPIWTGVVYAHSPTELYEVDPNTLKVTRVAAFGWPSGSDQMTDIALDKNGNMIGISFTTIYSVDPMTAKCKRIAAFNGSDFNGLSFVPPPSVDPNGEEILVGAAISGSVYKIDPQTGKQTMLGSYGQGMGSSGDIVAVEGATYATVTWSTADDWLVKVDTQTGKATPIGRTGFSHIWGLGYWKQQVFGFNDQGQFLLISTQSGKGRVADTSSVEWWGAGVTTIAPTIQ